MVSQDFEYFEPQNLGNGLGHPIKAWTRGVQLEAQALSQLYNVASLPFLHKHVAVMPDCHWGMGATVGSVIATKGAIVPAAVGVDIGCGMMTVCTDLYGKDLPDNLHGVRTAIENAVPHGRTNDGREGDRGAWHDLQRANVEKRGTQAHHARRSRPGHAGHRSAA